MLVGCTSTAVYPLYLGKLCEVQYNCIAYTSKPKYLGAQLIYKAYPHAADTVNDRCVGLLGLIMS